MSAEKKAEVVPFGKFKGQPVENLSSDPAYCEWLVQQDWFREKYVSIHTLIINNFGEPDSTPEHNLLQMRFLDKEFVAKVVKALHGDGFEEWLYDQKGNVTGKEFVEYKVRQIEFELKGWDVVIRTPENESYS